MRRWLNACTCRRPPPRCFNDSSRSASAASTRSDAALALADGVPTSPAAALAASPALELLSPLLEGLPLLLSPPLLLFVALPCSPCGCCGCCGVGAAAPSDRRCAARTSSSAASA
jgi:hypothetical protein